MDKSEYTKLIAEADSQIIKNLTLVCAVNSCIGMIKNYSSYVEAKNKAEMAKHQLNQWFPTTEKK